MKLLSLVMIARGAAELLPGMLAHHRELADELVVGDTGAGDGTGDAARAAGATVVPIAWNDDFAAARNAAQAAATGRWILLLDADERIGARDFPRLRRVLAGRDCALVQEARNYMSVRTHVEFQPAVGAYPELEGNYPGYFVSRRIGIFPNRPDIRFSGRVHESVLPAVQAAGLPIHRLDVPVHHFGYVMGDEANRDRSRRYRELARRKLADRPDDPAARLEWATALLEDGRPDEAAAELVRVTAGPAGEAAVVRGHVLLGRLRREAAALDEAAALLEEAVAQDPTSLFAWLELIRTRADQERWADVKGCLAAARRALDPGSLLLDREELRLLIKTGRLVRAAALADRLVAASPHWTELAPLAERLRRMTRGRPD
ncbi:MAG: glycosyltransferase [Candidatus Krumholzibacteriia bacterium]